MTTPQDPSQEPQQPPPYPAAPPPYPAAPPPPQRPIVGPGGLVLDPESQVYIPPGTKLASVGRRIGAYFLAIPLAIVTLGIGYAIWGLIVWSRGTTPALQVLGMRVWHVDHPGVPDWGDMALREVVGRFLVESIIGIIGIVSFVLFVTSDKRQSLHDMIAKTTVLHDPDKVLSPPRP